MDSAPEPAANPIRYDFATASDGCKLATMAIGRQDAPVLLLVHGLSQGKAIWHRQFASALAKRFHLIAFDLRGHGASSRVVDLASLGQSQRWADDVAAVLEHHGVTRFVGVGWSYGALVLMDYLRGLDVASDTVAGLAFIGSAGGLTPPRPAENMPQAAVAAYYRNHALSQSADFTDRMEGIETVVDMLTAERVPQADRAIMRASALAVPLEVRSAMMQRNLSNLDLIDRVTMPTGFLVGDRDASTNIESIRELVTQLPDSRAEHFSACGHTPFIEHQAQFDMALANMAGAWSQV